ncbi:hypothetical protein EVAR_44146_1 [Eumeta japonica]|uniref:Uncharacterized protein n=1 Tax=Eumeta variegata TaxID=151549 RepID=A0A4C1XLQ3_EUMVA|nr:hypothetical protein EVAR_44146_1 [Eumeta japonica]
MKQPPRHFVGSDQRPTNKVPKRSSPVLVLPLRGTRRDGWRTSSQLSLELPIPRCGNLSSVDTMALARGGILWQCQYPTGLAARTARAHSSEKRCISLSEITSSSRDRATRQTIQIRSAGELTRRPRTMRYPAPPPARHQTRTLAPFQMVHKSAAARPANEK